MDSKYRTKSSEGSGDDERFNKSRYQEKLGEHDVQRERVVTKGKSTRVSNGQDDSDRRLIQKTTQRWGQWEKCYNEPIRPVQGTGRTSTYGPYWTQQEGGEWEWRENAQIFSDGGWDRHVNDPIEDKADERDDDKAEKLCYFIDRTPEQMKNEKEGQGIIPPAARNQEQRQMPPQKLSKGARKRARAEALRNAPEKVKKGWKPFHLRTQSEDEFEREREGMTDSDSSVEL